MGSGAWSPTSYFARSDAKRARGVDTFDYSARAKASGDLRVHQTLDPQGMLVRESRDSAEHPESNAILISLDVTGSMGKVVRGIHQDLPRLHELILGHKYIPHPQILFAAVGDATCDQVPLQVGQFESDNRMDENLENIILEGGGGGSKSESYELTLYVAARLTSIDCFEKRGRKGYLFIIGDELAYTTVHRAQIQRIFGTDPQADIPLTQIIAEAKQKFHIYFVIPGGASHGKDKDVEQFWVKHLGREHVLSLADPRETSECIAATIGLKEGIISAPHPQSSNAQPDSSGGTLQRMINSLAKLFGGGKSDDFITGPRKL